MTVKELISKQEKQTPHNYMLRILPRPQEESFLLKNAKRLLLTSETLRHQEIVVRENVFRIINVCDDVIWTIFPYFYSCRAINS